MASKKFGLYQLPDRKGGYRPTWYVRRDIPEGLRQHFLNEAGKPRRVFMRTTGETRLARAEAVAAELWADWGAEIDAARKLGAGPFATVSGVQAAIDTWREARCAEAAGLQERIEVDAHHKLEMETRLNLSHRVRRQPLLSSHDLSNARGWPGRTASRPVVGKSDVSAARAYFELHPEASRDLGMPYLVGDLIGRLQVAVRDADGWTKIASFDAALDAATQAAGLLAKITPNVRENARQGFARAWLEVCQHQEAERQRAAFLMAAGGAPVKPEAVTVEGPVGRTFIPREGDLTMGEVVTAYRAQRAAKHGKKDTSAKYEHLFTALTDVLGADRPARSVTTADATAVRDFLATIPSNAKKFYPDRTLAEAAKLAAAEMAEAGALKASGKTPRKIKLLAPNTLRSYLVNFAAVANWAMAAGFMETNPAKGLAGPKRDSVKRRPFTSEELQAVFAGLFPRKESGEAAFWIPTILAYSGARLNEIAQLRVEDIKTVGGHYYIDLTPFDAKGVRVDGKRLKNRGSERVVPIHPELITIGLLDLVAVRRAAGADLLFPELKPDSEGRYSEAFSKNFGRFRKRIGVGDASTPLHSLRHGFRAAGRAAGLSNEIIDALGGWATKGEGQGYGDDRTDPVTVAENAAHLAKIALRGFSLAELCRAMEAETEVRKAA